MVGEARHLGRFYSHGSDAPQHALGCRIEIDARAKAVDRGAISRFGCRSRITPVRTELPVAIAPPGANGGIFRIRFTILSRCSAPEPWAEPCTKAVGNIESGR
jgi:hypothetical protein